MTSKEIQKQVAEQYKQCFIPKQPKRSPAQQSPLTGTSIRNGLPTPPYDGLANDRALEPTATPSPPGDGPKLVENSSRVPRLSCTSKRVTKRTKKPDSVIQMLVKKRRSRGIPITFKLTPEQLHMHKMEKLNCAKQRACKDHDRGPRMVSILDMLQRDWLIEHIIDPRFLPKDDDGQPLHFGEWPDPLFDAFEHLAWAAKQASRDLPSRFTGKASEIGALVMKELQRTQASELTPEILDAVAAGYTNNLPESGCVLPPRLVHYRQIYNREKEKRPQMAHVPHMWSRMQRLT